MSRAKMSLQVAARKAGACVVAGTVMVLMAGVGASIASGFTVLPLSLVVSAMADNDPSWLLPGGWALLFVGFVGYLAGATEDDAGSARSWLP